MHNRYQDLHAALVLLPECLKLYAKEGGVTGHWPPMSEGYWEIRERVGIRELEVTLRGFHPPSIQVPCDSSAMPGRLLPLLHVASTAAWSLSSRQSIRQFAIQLHDEDPEREDCLRFDAEATSTKVLLPDPMLSGPRDFKNSQRISY